MALIPQFYQKGLSQRYDLLGLWKKPPYTCPGRCCHTYLVKMPSYCPLVYYSRLTAEGWKEERLDVLGVRATKNLELEAVVEGEKLGNAGKDILLQYEAVQRMYVDRNTSGVIVLARSRHEGPR